METLQQKFDRVRSQPSDISAHTHILYELALECDHVTEMGVRGGVSTTFLYHALVHSLRKAERPRALVCYDINDCAVAHEFEEYSKLPGMPRYEFWQKDSRKANIERTELLFIDTLHAYDQLKTELKLHAHKVSRFIALHDTKAFGLHDEGNSSGPGLWLAVAEFLAENKKWTLKLKDDNQNGFTVLERVARL